MSNESKLALLTWFEELDRQDVPLVGGKNASLGEMIQKLTEVGVRVPGGFAVTAEAYRQFIAANDLDERVSAQIEAYRAGETPLAEAGAAIREMILGGELPEDLQAALDEAYVELSQRAGVDEVSVAARSSATAEDLPEASFAGQQETYLNVRGAQELRDAVRACFASLFTDRAIVYREHHGFEHMEVALSVGVQQMVRSDLGGAGVMFTLDPETGFPDAIVISAAWGLGETVVKGSVTPDEYAVYAPLLDREGLRPIIKRARGTKEHKMVLGEDGRKTRTVATTAEEQRRFVLDEDEILALARWGRIIEQHYDMPMDIEWARDGETGDLYIVQARPETVQSRRDGATYERYTLNTSASPLLQGSAVGSQIACAQAIVLEDMTEADQFVDGAILVTQTTDPDWVPLMKRASGIVTDQGGRTSHAAIVSRELGIPAVVGCGDATATLDSGQAITLSCAQGARGLVYDGELDYEVTSVDMSSLPEVDTPLMLNLADPDAALRNWRVPASGVGLARMEFIIEHQIQVHPMALAHYEQVEEEDARATIDQLTSAYETREEYFVEQLATGIATIAATRYPAPVIVRMSDFKTNEYAELIGGHHFEFSENNPMIGFRGAARYGHASYRDGFALECRAIRRVRETIGLDNVVVMIPFCRTLEEADGVLATMAEEGLARGENGLKVYVMAEIPSNILLATEFAERFDGFSIGSNDLTQLVLGIDRDSAELADSFDERNPAVKRAIEMLIRDAHAAGKPVGICGQAPSDHPDFAEFLVERGIDTISLNPDSVPAVLMRLAAMKSA